MTNRSWSQGWFLPNELVRSDCKGARSAAAATVRVVWDTLVMVKITFRNSKQLDNLGLILDTGVVLSVAGRLAAVGGGILII